MNKSEFFVARFTGHNARWVDHGLYSVFGSLGGTAELAAPSGDATMSSPQLFYAKNGGTGYWTITCGSIQFWVDNAAQSSYSLRPGKSALFAYDGLYFHALFSEEASRVSKYTPLTGVTLAVTNTFVSVLNLVIVPVGPLAALTIPFPGFAFDGQTIKISTTQDITALTLNPGSYNLIGGVTTLPANGFVSYIYVTANNAWYRNG